MRARRLQPFKPITISAGMYTKHYYNGSARIASRIGGGFAVHRDLELNDLENNPFTNHVTLVHTDNWQEKALKLNDLLQKGANCAGLDQGLSYEYTLEGSIIFNSDEKPDDEACYFYHSDHLGSSAFITTENGYATQFLAYTCAELVECVPFGETLSEQQNSTSYYSPFKFSAKEKDPETGYSYFGARYYSPELSVWLSVDPMSDKYPSYSAYNYTLLNPVKFIDPDGRSVWHPDSEGNLIADAGDNALTLSEYLGISYDEANAIFSNLNNWDGGKSNSTGIKDVSGHALTLNNDIAPNSNSFDADLSASLTAANGFVDGRMQSIKYGSQEVKYAQNINGKIRGPEVLSRVNSMDADKAMKRLKKIGRGGSFLGTSFAIYQFANSDMSGADVARLVGSVAISATAAIPFVGPLISVGLGVADSYGAFDDFYNKFD